MPDNEQVHPSLQNIVNDIGAIHAKKIKYVVTNFGGTIKIELHLPSGKSYSIRGHDSLDYLEITAIDGRLSIIPSVSNQIKVTTIE
jgi:hypothetical protein